MDSGDTAIKPKQVLFAQGSGSLARTFSPSLPPFPDPFSNEKAIPPNRLFSNSAQNPFRRFLRRHKPILSIFGLEQPPVPADSLGPADPHSFGASRQLDGDGKGFSPQASPQQIKTPVSRLLLKPISAPERLPRQRAQPE